MIVTLNEIEQWCLRAMAGSGAPPGVDEDAAAAATWFVARDFPVLAPLISALDRWQNDPRATELRARSAQGGVHHFDALGRSGVYLAGNLIDQVLAVAARFGEPVAVEVERLTDPLFLFPIALGYARRGWTLELSWRAGDASAAAGARVGADGPSMLGDERGLLDSNPVSLSILCGHKSHGVPAGPSLPVAVSADELARRYTAALERGVDVADETWTALKVQGMRALVPASAQSRARGAGAEISDNE